MANIQSVEYKGENGKLIAIELYSDGSKRTVEIKNGIVDYILNGTNEQYNSLSEKWKSN